MTELGLPEIGGLTGAVIGMIATFSYIWSKFKRDNAANSSEANLYNNLSNQVSILVSRIDNLEKIKNECQDELVKLRGQLSLLSTIEQENDKLRNKLDEKDAEIIKRDDDNRRSMLEILNLTNRIHDLELRLTKDETNCKNCEHWLRYKK